MLPSRYNIASLADLATLAATVPRPCEQTPASVDRDAGAHPNTLSLRVAMPLPRASTMDAILARGQPYQTVVYRNLAPMISTVHAVLTINGAAATPGTAVTGTRFVLALNSGATWTGELRA